MLERKSIFKGMACITAAQKNAPNPNCIYLKCPKHRTALRKAFFIEVPPPSVLVEFALLDFFIAGNREDYIGLNNTLLYLCCQTVKADRSKLRADEPMFLMNNPLASTFS